MAADPDTWTAEEWGELQSSLDDLARVDPAVAASARAFDDAVERAAYRARIGVPRKTFPRSKQ